MSPSTLVRFTMTFILVGPFLSFGQENADSVILNKDTRLDGRQKRGVRTKRSTGTAEPFTEAEEIAGLALHNKYRSEEGASNMEFMEWHPELARMAQDYTQGCLYEHSSQTNNGCYNITHDTVGENLHFSTGIVPLVEAVTAWYVEKQDYNFTSVTCAEDQVCGHYTQVVWAKSNLIGCGRAFCTELREYNGNVEKNAYFTSCNYALRGNYRKARPYVKGDPCTACRDETMTCKEQMCYKPGVDHQRPADKLRDCGATEATVVQTSIDIIRTTGKDDNTVIVTTSLKSSTDNKTVTQQSTTDKKDGDDDGGVANNVTVFPDTNISLPSNATDSRHIVIQTFKTLKTGQELHGKWLHGSKVHCMQS